MTLYEEYQRRIDVLTEAYNRCIENQNKAGMIRFKVKLLALEKTVSNLTLEQAESEYNPEKFYKGLLDL